MSGSTGDKPDSNGIHRIPSVETRLITAILLGLAASAALVFTTATPACACSCVETDDETAYADSDAVFSGTLTERAEAGLFPRPADEGVTLVFEVDSVYKGEVAQTQGIETAPDGASCGLEAEVGDTLLVFAYEDGSALRSSLCGGSRNAEVPLDPAIASANAPNSGEAGMPRRSSWPVMAAAGAALAVFLGAALWWWRRRRRTARRL